MSSTTHTISLKHIGETGLLPAYSDLLSMKSNRMRQLKPKPLARERFQVCLNDGNESFPIAFKNLPAPLPIEKIPADQLIEDILVSTLRRVQERSSPEVAAAAARYISLLLDSAI